MYLIKWIPGNASIFWCFIGWIWTNNNVPSSCQGRRRSLCQEFLAPCLAYGPSKKSGLLLESNVCVICLFSSFFMLIFVLRRKIAFPKHSLGLRALNARLITVCIFQSCTSMAVDIVDNMLFGLSCGWLRILCVLIQANQFVC